MVRHEFVRLEPPVQKFIQRRQHQRDDEHDEKGKLKTRLEQLAGIPRKNDERGGGEGIEQVAGAFERPAAEHDGHHYGSTDGGSLPARRGGVKPDGRHGQRAAPGASQTHRAQQGHDHSRKQGDPQPVNREEMHRAGAEKGFADVAGESRAPAEGHRPQKS